MKLLGNFKILIFVKIIEISNGSNNKVISIIKLLLIKYHMDNHYGVINV